MPSGRSWAVQAANARALMLADLSVPLTVKSPPANSRSSSLHSSWWAASVRALAMTFSPAKCIATPPTASERLP